MNFTDTTPRIERSLSGIKFFLPAPYSAGHTITEGEASQLNQVLAENVGNNLRDKIKAGVTVGEGENATTREHTPEEVQTLVDTYLASYEMGVRQRGESKPALDPVEREALKLAKDKAIQLIKDQGGKPADYDLEPIRDALFAANSDAFLAEAKKIIAAREKAKKGAENISLGGFDLTAALKPKEATPA